MLIGWCVGSLCYVFCLCVLIWCGLCGVVLMVGVVVCGCVGGGLLKFAVGIWLVDFPFVC